MTKTIGQPIPQPSMGMVPWTTKKLVLTVVFTYLWLQFSLLIFWRLKFRVERDGTLFGFGTHSTGNLDINYNQANKQVCVIPPLDPFGPDVLRYSDRSNEELRCNHRRSSKFTVDFENNLVRLKPSSSFWNNLECFYGPLGEDPDRSDTSKDIAYPMNGSSVKLAPDLDHIRAWCNHKNGREKYSDYFSVVQKKPELEEKLDELSKGKDFYSVMIIGKDSMSQLAFRRYMPRTREFLVKKMDAVEFNGLNSLGPGTLWSIIPLFSGLDLNQYRSICGSGYHDDCPHIWKDFANQGYRTSYEEDGRTKIFEVEGNGFMNSPVHYDFNKAGKMFSSLKSITSVYCYGSRLSYNVLLKNMCRMVSTFWDKPFWSFMWSDILTHSSSYMATWSDKPTLSSLMYLQKKHLLNNTILIVISDHGSRYGTFREKTRQGLLEERLPLLYIVLPEKFKQKYPLATENLRENAKRLTNAFDVHEMMKDLLNLEGISDERIRERGRDPSILTSRNVSLFLPISSNRSCEMIGLNFVYCACIFRSTIPTDASMVQMIALRAIQSINRNLTTFPQCSSLELHNITVAYKLGVQVSLKDEHDRLEKTREESLRAVDGHFEVGFQTRPGTATFFVTAYSGDSGEVRIEDVSRVTEHEQESSCMPVKSLRPFCACKS